MAASNGANVLLARAESAAGLAPAPELRRAGLGRNERVLAVEPDTRQYRLMEESLDSDGVRVLPASSVLEALLQLVVSSTPVILYDMDGPEPWREALEQFRRLRRDSRVIFLSRLADTRLWIDVLEAGGYDLLMKPFRPQEIRCIVRNALSRRAAAL